MFDFVFWAFLLLDDNFLLVYVWFNKKRAAQVLMAQIPHLQHFTMALVDTIFVPKVIAKQLALLVALETGLVTCQQITAVIQWLTSNFSSRSRLIRQLHQEQLRVTTQDDWMDLAERIDNIQGNDVWRSDPNCALYERDRIAARIDEYVHLMRRRDIFELMFVLRGSIGRNKFGLLHEGLFTRAMAGSKVLTETYHNVVCAALDFVCDAPILSGEEPIPTDARLAFFNETRHAYGRTALLLSGGAALGFYHIGVVKTLIENRLMPRVIGGSSAGSIVCSMIGTRTDEECVHDLFQVKGTETPGHSGRIAYDFFRPIVKVDQTTTDYNYKQNPRKGGIIGVMMEVYYNTAGAFHDAKRTLQGFVPIPMRRLTSFWYDLLTGNTRPRDIFKNDTAHFRECVRLNVGNFTFQEAFDRTGRILNIVVTPNNSSDPPRLLNYLTAPHVMVWSAAVASSSLPGVFEANRLVVKEADGWERYESGGGQVFSDGSMEQDLPMQQLSEMFNVNHFIISQANPHAVMFASYNQKVSVWNNPFTGFVHQILVFLKDQVRSWLLHLVSCVGARRITPLFETQRGIGATFFTQEYEGRSSDISLIPWLSHRGLFSAMMHIIYNPSEPEFRDWIQAAERETWKFIPAIKSHIAEEITLDRCVQRLRRRMVHESWEKHQLGSIEGFHQNSTTENHKMEGRVPSFFTSNSLVNLSGLGVADQPATDDLHDYSSGTQPPILAVAPTSLVVTSEVGLNSGWGGMGLRGNRSTNNLQRTSSDASGLFIDEEEARQQDAGENATQHPVISGTTTAVNKNSISSQSLPARNNSNDSGFFNDKGYVKTTSMAKFYYRKSASKEPLNEYESIQKTPSDSFIDRDVSSNRRSSERISPKASRHTRIKSKSHADLSTQEFVPIKD
jgi:TAG lipase / steryl ester hydrolase / phospholipase A2 / LPA acyltransferase